jgi:dynactin complex subunit
MAKLPTKDDLAAVETCLDRRIDKLDAKLDRLDTKLSKFEEREIDKRLQLEVRVSAIEKHLGLDKKIAA